MEMPDGYGTLQKFKEYDWNYRLGEALTLMKEMAEALEMADRWLSPDGYDLSTEKKIKETIRKFKEWK